jgi:tRNA(Arg) A34 adenosine deaminase TadA
MNSKIINRALKYSEKSNFLKHPMGCVIFKGNKVVSSGYNMILGSGRATLHAEQLAIEQLARRHNRLRDLRKLLTNDLVKNSTKNSAKISQKHSLIPYLEPQCRKGA